MFGKAEKNAIAWRFCAGVFVVPYFQFDFYFSAVSDKKVRVSGLGKLRLLRGDFFYSVFFRLLNFVKILRHALDKKLKICYIN